METYNVILKEADDEMVANRIKKGEYGKGLLRVDVTEGCGEFFCDGQKVLIDDCSAILVEENTVTLHNEDGDFIFAIESKGE